MSGPEVQLWTEVFSHALCLQKRAQKGEERVTLQTQLHVLTPTHPSTVSPPFLALSLCLSLHSNLHGCGGKPITSSLRCKLNKLRWDVFTFLSWQTMVGSKGAGARTKEGQQEDKHVTSGLTHPKPVQLRIVTKWFMLLQNFRHRYLLRKTLNCVVSRFVRFIQVEWVVFIMARVKIFSFTPPLRTKMERKPYSL